VSRCPFCFFPRRVKQTFSVDAFPLFPLLTTMARVAPFFFLFFFPARTALRISSRPRRRSLSPSPLPLPPFHNRQGEVATPPSTRIFNLFCVERDSYISFCSPLFFFFVEGPRRKRAPSSLFLFFSFSPDGMGGGLLNVSGLERAQESVGFFPSREEN